MSEEEKAVQAVSRLEREAATADDPPPEQAVLATMAVMASTTAGMMMDEDQLRAEAETAVALGIAPVEPSARALRSSVLDAWQVNFAKATRLLEWAETERASTPVGAGGAMSLVLLAGYQVQFVHWSHGPPTSLGAQVIQVVKLDGAQRVIYSVPAVRPLTAIDSYHVILPSTRTVHRKGPAASRQRVSDEVMDLYRLWLTSSPDLGVGAVCDWCATPTAESVCRCPLCALSYHTACARRCTQEPLPQVRTARLPEQLSPQNVCDVCKLHSTADRQSAL